MRLAQALSVHGSFALCEISKGVVIMWIGDIATADVIGDFVGTLASPARALRDASFILR